MARRRCIRCRHYEGIDPLDDLGMCHECRAGFASVITGNLAKPTYVFRMARSASGMRGLQRQINAERAIANAVALSLKYLKP